MSAKKKTKLDPNDPLTPVRVFMEELDAVNARAVDVTRLAHARGAKAEQLAEVMRVSVRTVYNRLEGLPPKSNKGTSNKGKT